MFLTLFKINKMDCPSEEQLIRMALSDIEHIHSLKFDIENRQLEILHSNSNQDILNKLNTLQLDTSIIYQKPFNGDLTIDDSTIRQRSLLWQVLTINFLFFIIELIFGVVSKSMGLIADGLDMLADSAVYLLALLAVGNSIVSKKKTAKIAGYFQMTLAFIGVIETIRRFISIEAPPSFNAMIIVSFFALIGNSLCLYLMQKNKSNEAHMKASMIFTSNDVIVNLGVIVAGLLVYFLNSRYPDLIIGFIVFILVVNGAIKILKLAK